MALDGLRGVAAIIVAIWHRRYWISGYGDWHGHLAVDFFFLLSGFVIAHAYGERIVTRQLPVRDYLVARAIRLYPLIFVGAALGLGTLLIESAEKHWLGLALKAFVAFPFGLAALPQPFFEQPFRIDLPVWSLFFEIIANVVFVALIPRLSFNALLAVTFILAGGLIAAAWAYGGLSFGFSWGSLPAGLLRVGFPFSAGVLLQRVHSTRDLTIKSLPVWLTAPLLTAILMTPMFGSKSAEVGFCLAAVFVGFPLILASAANDLPSPLWLRLSAISAALSYPLYVLHMPLLQILDLVPKFDSLPVLTRFAISSLICIGSSTIIGRFYDIPLRAALSKIYRRRRQARVATAL